MISVGDVTDDGVGDVVVGAATGYHATVFASPITGTVYEDEAVAELVSTFEGGISSVGDRIDSGGDLTGDGLADIAATERSRRVRRAGGLRGSNGRHVVLG